MAHGGQNVSNTVISRLLDLGFVLQDWNFTTRDWRTLMLSDRGRLAAEKQAELLADAIKRDETLEAPVDGSPGPAP